MLPAPGQGALAIECRDNDEQTIFKLSPLNDLPTHAAVLAERVVLAQLRAGCSAPVGAHARLGDDGKFHLSAVVLSADGKRRLVARAEAASDELVSIGQSVANALLAQGAVELIASAKNESN